MPWIHKIPPMISALAFGYGVGMATPDSTIDDLGHAMQRTQDHRAAPPYGPPPGYAWVNVGPQWAGYGPPPGNAQSSHGGELALNGAHESSRLARLRERGDANAGAHCNLHHPTQSTLPGYASSEELGDEDVDDLDGAAKEALSRLQLPDFEVPITRRALKYVRFLTRTNRGRDLFETWLKRSGRYQELIQQALREWHLPEDLIWVAMIESGFEPRAKSPAGAVGLWQFMRPTGEVYGLEVSTHMDDRMNPVKATRAAAHHLRDLHQRFGSWDLALAAYNMGYEQLLERIDRYGTTDFNELGRQRALPSETAAYVPKIIAAALVANNLERYGFEEVKVHRPIHHAELLVPGGTRVSTLARAAGVSSAAIRTLNPQLRVDFVPPSGDHVIYLPAESLSRARAALPAMLSDDRRASSDADVLAPEDLVGLSGGKKRRHDDWSEDENLLGMLPKPKRRTLREMRGRDADDDPVAALAEEFEPKRADRETVMYRVGAGDTLIGIARQFAVDIDDLARENGLDSDDTLREGALLRLSVKRKVLERWKKGAADEKRSIGRRGGDDVEG